MKRTILLISVLSLFIFCGPKQDELERIIEDGVEVIVNHLEPYEIAGEPVTFTLEEEFTIDTEKDEIAETGLVDFSPFDIDSDGNIYFFTLKSDENCIYKFGKKGRFLTSFAKKGQGPGEIGQAPYGLDINEKDEILVYNGITGKTSIFSTSGVLINEISTVRMLTTLSLLRNGNYLISYFERYSPTSDLVQRKKLSIFDAEMKEINELAGLDYPNPMKQEKKTAIEDDFVQCVGNGYIYVGKRKLGYEIWIYNLDGDLIRKIRKIYTPVKVSKEYMNRFYEQRERRLSKENLDKYYFPENFPAFQYMVADEKGKLYVMTYEGNKSSEKQIFDIFNSEGVFIKREAFPSIPKIKNFRIYFAREKDSGFKELVVYRMNWE